MAFMTQHKIDCHLMTHALSGIPAECGDAGFISQDEKSCLAILLDVLGHGPEAHEVADKALAYIKKHSSFALPALMGGLHDILYGTRGCVASFCRLDFASRTLRFCGIGNITCRLFGVSTNRLVPQDGIIGYTIPTPVERTIRIASQDILIMHSDGIHDHFQPHDLPGLLTGSSREIAERVMEHFSTENDDTSCLVMRCSP